VTERIAMSLSVNTKIGMVYISPNGIPHHPSRTGEIRNGVRVSSAELSRAEVDDLGISGLVDLSKCRCDGEAQ
jgi:hypothetical protein